MPWKPPAPAAKCPTCDKSVYAAEEVLACNKKWHKTCLKCGVCKKVVAKGMYLEKDGMPYCEKACFGQVSGVTGMRAGGGQSGGGGMSGIGSGAQGSVVEK